FTGLSLAQQLADLGDVAPVDFDPEELPADEHATVESAAAREHYLDVGPSNLRQLHDNISNPRYDGVPVSRKQLMEEEDEDDDDEGRGEDEDVEDVKDEAVHEAGSSDGGVDAQDGDLDVPSSESEYEGLRDEPKDDGDEHESEHDEHTSGKNEDLAGALRQTRSEDRKKGKAVSRQIVLWDSLMDCRIRLQKSVTACQSVRGCKLVDSPEFNESPECQTALRAMLDESLALSDELFALQEDLVSLDEIIELPPRKRRKLDTSTSISSVSVSGYAQELEEATATASAYEHALHPHIVRTLNKWSAKIQAVAPSVLLPTNRNAFSFKGQHIKSAVQLIDETLADHAKLLARTQVLRGLAANGEAGDAGAEDDRNTDEIFDDTDFYQQLLRAVIDARGSGDAEGDQDWRIAQKQRKTKKKVDTKASKGRKVRYQVHEKIQNFMVPVPIVGGWHEEQIDELFASLLGRGYEQTAREAPSAAQPDAILDGFRVFG
ncbi:TRAUB-domain-containing protein, partial [Fistulina hepatica ATCC 64428]